MNDLTPEAQARLQAEPEATLSPQRRRWLKAVQRDLYGMPAEVLAPKCFDTGRSWFES